MEERATWTKEEHDAREAHRKETIRLTELIKRYRENPDADADVAPHLVGRQR